MGRPRKSNSEEKKRRAKSTPDVDPSTANLLPPGWKYIRNKNSDDYTFITSSRKSLAGSDAVIEFMSSSKSYVAQDIENFIQWREKVNELEKCVSNSSKRVRMTIRQAGVNHVL